MCEVHGASGAEDPRDNHFWVKGSLIRANWGGGKGIHVRTCMHLNGNAINRLSRPFAKFLLESVIGPIGGNPCSGWDSPSTPLTKRWVYGPNGTRSLIRANWGYDALDTGMFQHFFGHVG